MKVTFAKNVKKQTGTIDDMIYYTVPGNSTIYGRRVPKMPHQPMNDKFKNISLALKAINPSEAYRADLKEYLDQLKEDDPEVTFLSWHNIYVKMMWALAAKFPSVNLETITKEQIYAENLPCKTVLEAIDAELIPFIHHPGEMTNPI
jgi:hypothetical protein